MSGRPDSDLPPDTQTSPEREGDAPETVEDAPEGLPEDLPEAEDEDLLAEQARRARWAAVGTGAVLALAGTAAALLRASGTAPALVPVAYACGAAVCALASVLGARGRTRRSLWAAVAGVMIMALGDQFD
ncbi:hypothetical protein QWL27_28480 [Streptomyces thermocarboxydus]|uniref:Uncharacterized protein n=1 Tax=Streptomyces cellulosae TaxID=1968 RepID=A0ABW6JRQ8_STRCE|nr:hypothetical protein [Streptomyces sp. AC04842]MDN3289657.1 hypothetical protein [Streptomyces thermocarboxydus]